MEDGECRSDSGDGLRVVRVGTHALTSSSRTTLWKRLSQHKGQKASGGGNHRGSIFRLLVGSTVLIWTHVSSQHRRAMQLGSCRCSLPLLATPGMWA